MFLILHQIQNSKKRTDDFGIQINALQEVTVNISEAKLICTGHIFDKNDLKNFQYFNTENISEISTIIQFDTFKIEVAEDYKYITGHLQ